MAKKTLYAALFHCKCQKGFVAPIVFFTVGNVSKWLFDSALTFRDFVPRLELLSPLGIF